MIYGKTTFCNEKLYFKSATKGLLRQLYVCGLSKSALNNIPSLCVSYNLNGHEELRYKEMNNRIE